VIVCGHVIWFTEYRWQRLADILEKVGHITCASLVIPFFRGEVEVLSVVFGLFVACVFWYLSMHFSHAS